eukprot:2833922-Rhodomonas_salina.1
MDISQQMRKLPRASHTSSTSQLDPTVFRYWRRRRRCVGRYPRRQQEVVILGQYQFSTVDGVGG